MVAVCGAFVLSASSTFGQISYVESWSPVVTYSSPGITYYAAAPITTYYAPSAVTTYYAAPPAIDYYAPAPVTSYYAPAPAFYAPTTYTYYAPEPVVAYTPSAAVYGYRPLYVPGQPIRNTLRAIIR
jgi:hypothetical protein